ncbi:hypothetical protein BGZ49_004154 [Haplosporangium sp. Z 27]|nr:hypothetical protein BGZ49_004154 [Haplosporangium sp. Z 27]
MRDQLTRSLQRLNTNYVDIFFVHNPEYYLMSNVNDTEVNIKKHQDILLKRMSNLFEELEREIERGRIHAYGVSSNSFSLKPSHAHFLPYQDLISMASQAFEKVQEHSKKIDKETSHSDSLLMDKVNASSIGSPTSSHFPVPIKPTHRKTHGLGFLQMPGNLLEMEGVQTTAKWAKRQGLRVFLNRPLNAMSSNHPVRLASYPQPLSPTYAEAKKQLFDLLSAIGQQREYLQSKMIRLREIVESLDASLNSGNMSIMHLEGTSIAGLLHQELAKPVRINPSSQLHSHANAHSEHQSLEQENTRGKGHHIGETAHSNRNRHRSHPATFSDKKFSSATPQNASIKPSVQEIDQLVKYLDQFARVFQQQVRFQESSRVEKMLTDKGIDLKGESIEKFAIEYLLEHTQVDSVLLGMKRDTYVDFAHDLLKAE